MSASPTHNMVRPDWLAATVEAALEPEQLVVDAHHHLYDRPGARYLLEEHLADLYSGHDVRATVLVQARAMYRTDGPPESQPLGETEFANGVAAMSASGGYGPARVCAGIVGYADLRHGDAVRPLLERHLAAAGGPAGEGGRFCGVRHSLTWDSDSSLLNHAYPLSEDMMEAPAFRAAFAHLAPLHLSFDAWLFFHQLPRLAALAQAFESTPIVLDHCGGILGVAGYAGRTGEVFVQWRSGLQQLARCPNVMVKLSGLGMRFGGFGFEDGEQAPSSQQLADAWRPWIETCIETFGPERCMFGSNFPVDKASYAYAIGLNALKRIVAGASPAEKDHIFWRSAQRFYRLHTPSLPALVQSAV
jgi:L-fuconolactonase